MAIEYQKDLAYSMMCPNKYFSYQCHKHQIPYSRTIILGSKNSPKYATTYFWKKIRK